MSRRLQAGLLAVLILAAAGLWMWRYAAPADEREIKRRLHDFADAFNVASTDGLATTARAARLGQFFTEDIVVELGSGSPPIHGRDTLIGMAARLQPRTAAFVLELNDLGVTMVDPARANVALTAVIRRRVIGSGEQSLDAREFSAELQKNNGEWRVSRVAAVETLRK
jgi:hypothetical protein